MNRRQFVVAGCTTTLAGSIVAAAVKPSLLELRWLKMRNTTDNEVLRTSDFLKNGALPALKRAGVNPIGFFSSVIAPDSPFILTVAQFPNLAAMETMREKESQDPGYLKARQAYNTEHELGYQRLDSSILRCFETVPRIELPPANEKGHVFELRMYESNNGTTLARKIKMFNDTEIGIFRRLGMRPVFFGETIVGAKMPNLTYMLAFESLAAREAAWSAFGADPEWKELRSKAGNSDAELVSNISNSILRALAFSEVR